MKWRIIVVCICCIALRLPSLAQESSGTLADTVQVNALLAKSKELIGSEPEHSISLSTQARKLAEEIEFPKGAALALKNIGIVYYTQTKYLEAISYWRQSIAIFQSINDLAGVANILNNIGVIYSIQGDYVKALENYLESLKFAEQSNNKERISSALINIGATYALKPETYDKALEYYLRALPLTEELKDINGLGTTAVNIGEIYSNQGNSKLALQYFERSLKVYKEAKDEVHIPYAYNAIAKEYKKGGKYDLALQFHEKALTTAQKVNNKLYMMHSLMGLASTYSAKGALQESIDRYKWAERLGAEIVALDELKDIYQGLSANYASLRKYDKAFQYQSLYTGAKDSLYNIATDKKLARMEFDFNLKKKQGEINLLTREQELKDLKLRKQKLAQNFLIVGLGMIFVIAFIIFRNYRAKVKINKVLDHQKEQIEHLLLNILPDEVAKELQDTGAATPRHYSNVSVLFTDFKGFTALADKMSPQELVEELNVCFMAFDNIIERHGLEKIKTIGDSYMCAGGIPTPDEEHPFRMMKAGFEIQDYVLKNNLRRKTKGLPPWDIRIGIHIGPVVAGVVGKKKYAYDIWGSTVNIASRMESNGAPGQINISAAMYDVIKDEYICSHRGKIYAKNVGEIDMYFVEHEIKIPVKEFQPHNILQ